MTKPEGIPSEVWVAAENALDLLLCNCRESSGSTEQLRTDSIEPIARAILADRNASKWQPIETAPKDTTTILASWHLYGERYAVQPIWWAVHSKRPRWLHSYGGEEVDRPTHWLPLPKPPHNPKDAQ